MQRKSIVVFVTDRSDCLRLVRHGKKLAEQHDCALQVISIQPTCKLSPFALKELQVLYDSTKRSGGEMTILFNRDTALTAAVAAKKLQAIHVVSGTPKHTFVDAVRLLLPELPWTVVDADERAVTFPPLPVTIR